MRRIFLYFVALFLTNYSYSQSVGIGTNSPNTAAIVDINVPDPTANPQGMLLPRLTTVQRTALGGGIGVGDEGLTVFDTDDSTIYTWGGVVWTAVGADDGDWTDNAGDLEFQTGSVYIGLTPSGTEILGAGLGATSFGGGISTIFGYRDGSNVANEGGTGWNTGGINSAIKGFSFWGNNFTAGVSGHSWLDFNSSAAVIGYDELNSQYGALAFRDASGNYWGAYVSSDQYVGGDLGVGALTPQNDLHVQGGARITDLSSVGDGIVQADLNGDVSKLDYTGNTLNYLRGDGTWGLLGGADADWVTAGGFVYNSTNNIGIGIATPAHPLHIYGTTDQELRVEGDANGADASIILKTNGGVFDHLELSKNSSTSGGTTAGVSLNNLSRVTSGASAGALMLQVITNNPMHFVTDNTERMRIEAGGDIGIGETNPGTKLDINGGLTIQPQPTNAGPNFTVGNASYIQIGLGGAFTISNGLKVGQILILEGVSVGNIINDVGNVNLSTISYVLGVDDTLTLIWNGTQWLELSRSNN